MADQRFKYYIEVLKPRASILLTFIGVCAAIVAGNGEISWRLLLITFTIFVASAGANGLTNYLDCGIDAKMLRTRNRALPSKRINPPERVLPLNITLVIIGLGLAYYLHYLCFIADIIGTLAAVIGRKKVTCVFPQGMIASCAPVLMGWFAIEPAFRWEIVLLCILIGIWLPLHVWSVMLANRDDYINAGLTYFPMSWEPVNVVKVLISFSLVLSITAITLYFIAGFTLFYLIIAIILSIAMVFASFRLMISGIDKNAWKLYKLSAFPFLGILFLVMCLDIWIF